MPKNSFLQTAIAIAAAFFMQTPLMSQSIDFSTVGSLYPSSKCVIGSQVPGKADQILVDIGDEVKKNQLLVVIDPTFFKIELAKRESLLESSRIELADAETNLMRMQRLWEKNEGQTPSISLKKYEEAKTRYDQAQALVKQEKEERRRAQANLDETVIRAPFDGIITKRGIERGESLTAIPVTPLVEIQSITPIYLEFSIPQAYLKFVRVGTPLEFEVEGVELKQNEAVIGLIYPFIDESTRSVRCRAVLPNQDKTLRPGSLAKITIKGITL